MYVISIKRLKDYCGNTLNKPEWEYATFDNFSGCISSGYPIFGSLNRAVIFSTMESAKEWANDNLKYINVSNYDLSSLAIRKIYFKTVDQLH